MKKFHEFVQRKERDDIRLLVLNILEADPDTPMTDKASLSTFERREELLKDPALSQIINQANNRGAIIDLINRAGRDESITVGTLIDAIAIGE